MLDGFPRNEAQSDALDELLRELDRELDAILFFDLSDDVAIDRMLGRAGEEQRTDDTPEAIANRLDVYHSKTEPVVEHYRIDRQARPAPRGPQHRRGVARDPGRRSTRWERARDHPQVARTRSS